MTGFGVGESESEYWKVRIFAKSVNGKSLDIFVKSNVNLMPIEMAIRKKVKDYIKRGTVNISIEVEPKRMDYIIDPQRILQNVNLVKSLAKELSLQVSDDVVFEVGLRYAEKTIEEVDEKLQETIDKALDVAIKNLVESRKEEGETLKKDMESRLRRIEDMLSKILEIKDQLYESLKNRVLEKAKELVLQEMHPTVINEIAFLLSRADIEEEITRFKAHISRAKELLKTEDEVGKKLDFVLQEMHREINTLGNKMPELSEYVVEIKSEIDRLKQQTANVE